jgi:hypothetical protein
MDKELSIAPIGIACVVELKHLFCSMPRMAWPMAMQNDNC